MHTNLMKFGSNCVQTVIWLRNVSCLRVRFVWVNCLWKQGNVVACEFIVAHTPSNPPSLTYAASKTDSVEIFPKVNLGQHAVELVLV